MAAELPQRCYRNVEVVAVVIVAVVVAVVVVAVVVVAVVVVAVVVVAVVVDAPLPSYSLSVISSSTSGERERLSLKKLINFLQRQREISSLDLSEFLLPTTLFRLFHLLPNPSPSIQFSGGCCCRCCCCRCCCCCCRHCYCCCRCCCVVGRGSKTNSKLK